MEPFSALLALCAGNSPVPVNSLHKGQWRGALMFSLICAWINGWVNNREAGDLRRHCGHYDVTVMLSISHEHDTTMSMTPYIPCSYPFSRKKTIFFFQCEERIREIKKKGVIICLWSIKPSRPKLLASQNITISHFFIRTLGKQAFVIEEPLSGIMCWKVEWGWTNLKFHLSNSLKHT